MNNQTSAEYIHLELGKEIYSLAGYYRPEKEVILDFEERQVLYVTGQSVVESSCCGARSWSYITVPGYVKHWQFKKNVNGLPVSEVTPIGDTNTREKIKAVLLSKEQAEQSIIDFW